MAMQEFTWFPDSDSSSDTKPNTKVSKFGDGYEQRASTGLNSNPAKWSLKFTRTREDAKNILAFLRQHGAVKAFLWITPLQEEGVYVCRGWKTTQLKNGIIEISVEFEQVFER